MTRSVRQACALATLWVLPMAGCAATDPLLRTDVWHPTGANEMKIAPQGANPVDRVRGREPSGGANGALAAAAIHRLRTGHVTPLPDSAISDMHGGQSSSAAPAGGQ